MSECRWPNVGEFHECRIKELRPKGDESEPKKKYDIFRDAWPELYDHLTKTEGIKREKRTYPITSEGSTLHTWKWFCDQVG